MRVLSIQGCMAAGKTTALRNVEKNLSDVHASYEWNDHIMDKLRQHNYDTKTQEGFIGTQRIWIEKEVQRFEQAKATGASCVIMDFGAEEIEFFTLCWPKTLGLNWNIEELMKEELKNLRECMPHRILYLEASYEKLLTNKKSDLVRPRNYFDTYCKQLMPLKEAWFHAKTNVDYLDINEKNSDEVGEEVIQWVQKYII